MHYRGSGELSAHQVSFFLSIIFLAVFSYILGALDSAHASVVIPDDPFKTRQQCIGTVNALDGMALLGTKYHELKENCNQDVDLQETYHDIIRTLKVLGEIGEVKILD